MMSVVVLPLLGQENVPYHAGIRVSHGFLMNHHKTMKILNEKIPYSYELFIAKASNGEKPWQKFYRYPFYGVSYNLLHSGSPSYLGKIHSIYPFMVFFLTKPEHVLNLNIRFGAGVSYVEKIFHPVNNYKNTSISTPLNAILHFGIEGKLRIVPQVYISGGGAFTHISNGTYKKPNTGLNYVMASAGVSYAFGKMTLPTKTNETENNIVKKMQYTVYLSGGVKTYSKYDDTKYTASGLSFEASRVHLAFTQYSGKLDLFYDTSDYAYFVRDEKEITKIQTIKPGIAVGYAFHFGKLSADVNVGRYLYAKNQEFGLFYQRLALRYIINNMFNINLGLKTHWGQADYIEFAIGYKIVTE